MSENKKPVLSDKTGQQLGQTMQMMAAIQRENRDLMAMQTAALQEISLAIRGGTNHFPVTISYDGTTYAFDGVTVEEIMEAYNKGLLPVIVLVYEGTAYFAPLTKVTEKDGAVTMLSFASDGNRPLLQPGTYSIIVPTKKLNVGTSTSVDAAAANFCIRLGDADIAQRIKMATSILLAGSTESILKGG